MPTARIPAVAGSFYPSDPEVLGCMVDCLLKDARSSAGDTPRSAGWAHVVPHAGYAYSGSTAAQAYSHIAAAACRGWSPARVLILGPTHRVAIEGVARSGASEFVTPLGPVEVDSEAEARLDSLPFVVTAPEVHELEHSIEVQIPFLQRVLPGVPIVPLAVGDASPEQVGAVIEAFAARGEPDEPGDPDEPSDSTLVLVSTDLSHYLPYEQAQEVDAVTLEAVRSLTLPVSPYQACGARPLNGLLHVARTRGSTAEVIAACNSADTAGERRRVVGYAAVVFTDGSPSHDRVHERAAERAGGRAGEEP